MIALPPFVADAIKRIETAGFEAVAVGGCVRDMLAGKTPHDYDIATSATPDEICAVFSGERLIETGLQHGTVTVLLSGEPLEITTYRQDGAYSDGRHPDEVVFSRNLSDDLSRRDFTVNAMAFHPTRGVTDLFSGQADLKAGVLRAVGEPRVRFSEDALRVLRGLRFAAQHGFSIEPQTAAAMRAMRDTLSPVSAERIYAEMTAFLCGKDVTRVLLTFPEIVCAVVPELKDTVGFSQNNRHHIHTVYTHIARVVGNVPATPALRWAALLHDCGKPACATVDAAGESHFTGHPQESAQRAEAVLSRLRADNRTKAAALELIELHDLRTPPTEKAVKRLLSKVGETRFFELCDLATADRKAQNPAFFAPSKAREDAVRDLGKKLLSEQSCLSLAELAVSGDDLLSAGIPAGKELGDTLRRLLDLVLDGECENTKEELLKHI
ncbi:MAG: HD domain-containing protein [Clostridia bacterium]|nr:HD domain-containing protein [Clostridia bacterium]